jgi:hypothetical protein
LVLFRPDPATGVLGYVRYTWSPRDPWALLGHGFVGVAPLFGGALVLAALLFALAPEELARSWLAVELAGDRAAFEVQLGDGLVRVSDAVGALLAPGLWALPKTWVLGYLALCVGTHLAPSGPDLRGAWPSLAVSVVLLGLVDLGIGLALGDAGAAWVLAAASLMVPVAAVLALAAALVGAALVGVLGVATVWSTVTGRGLLAPLGAALGEPWRLVVVGAVGTVALRVVAW